MKNITEGNKLIAEFMGAKLIPKTLKGPYTVIGCYFDGDSPTYNGISLSNLKYHSNWNWLKPVIDKIIETIGIKSIDECTSDEWFYSTNITRMYIGVSIEQAHHYVVEYIKWYNKNGKI